MEQYLTWDIEEFTQKLNEQLADLGFSSVTERDVSDYYWGRTTGFDARDLYQQLEHYHALKAHIERGETKRIEEEERQGRVKWRKAKRERGDEKRKLDQAEWKLNPANQPAIKRHKRTAYLQKKRIEKGLPEDQELELSILLSRRWIRRNIS